MTETRKLLIAVVIVIASMMALTFYRAITNPETYDPDGCTVTEYESGYVHYSMGCEP